MVPDIYKSIQAAIFIYILLYHKTYTQMLDKQKYHRERRCETYNYIKICFVVSLLSFQKAI